MNNTDKPFVYSEALETRDTLEAIIDNKYIEINKLQQRMNSINDKIEAYEQEQRVLDE